MTSLPDTPMHPEYKNILIIKPGAVGDLLQLSPTVRAVKRRYPDARVSVLVGSAAAATLFRHNPHVDETVVFDRKGKHRSFLAFLALWREVHRSRYDLVINFQRSNLKAWLLVAAAIPCRVLIYRNARNRSVHAVVNHLETVAPLGITASDLNLELHTGADDERFAEELFRANGLSGKTVVALNPGASNRIKCWSTRQFSALGDRLARELDARVILTGGGDERDLAEEIGSHMTQPPLDLIGRTSILQLGAVLKKCTVLVSGDTGPLHLATAVGTPVVALFGAIDPARTGPVGEGHLVLRHSEIGCVPCVAKKCRNPRFLECMGKITVDEVFSAISVMLATFVGKTSQ